MDYAFFVNLFKTRNLSYFVLVLEIHVHDDAFCIWVNLDGVVAGEELDSAHCNLQNHFQQGATKFFVPHDSGKDKVISNI